MTESIQDQGGIIVDWKEKARLKRTPASIEEETAIAREAVLPHGGDGNESYEEAMRLFEEKQLREDDDV